MKIVFMPLQFKATCKHPEIKRFFFHVEDNIKMSTQVYRIHVDDL